jgi:hypothetical protein
MNPDRAIGLVLSCSVGAVLALGSWLLWRAHHAPPPPPPATPTPTVTGTATPTETPTLALPRAAAGYRLAGTVVGDVAYAVIESPGGRSELVRAGQIVKGLGQLMAIEEERVVIAGTEGDFALTVRAAPTASPAPPATPTTAAPEPPPRDRSGSESSP